MSSGKNDWESVAALGVSEAWALAFGQGTRK
jgi:hypothetical protein